RIFAQRLQQSEPGSRAAATARLYRYYVSHVDAAARLLYPNMLRLDVPPGASFADGTAALDWMDAERHCLAAAVVQAAGWDENESTALHNLGIVDFDRGRLSLAAEHYGRAAEIYRRLDRRDPLAASLVNLGLVHLRSGALAAADATLGEAEVLMRAADNRIGQAITLHNLGMVNHQQGRYQLAADRLTAARQS